MTITLEEVLQLDTADALANFREQFNLNEGEVYLDGNSLGAMPKQATKQVIEVMESQWSKSQIKSWNNHDWVDLAERIGNKIAHLIGAKDGEVICTDSTSINLFKAVSCGLQLNPKRKTILLEASNFPTDNYVVQGLVAQLGNGYEIRFADEAELYDKINKDVAVVCLTQVHYKTGRKLDMNAITAYAQAQGCIVIWDLCHSAGAFPVDLNQTNADLAVGCTYKFLNGGPGSPAYIFMAQRHHGSAQQPLTGWWGHDAPFEFTRDYKPGQGIKQLFTGTPAILSLAVMEVGVDIHCQADSIEMLKKSHGLTDLFVRLIEQECSGFGLTLASPRNADQRGNQVALQHTEGYAMMQALIAAGVIGDFRAPDILRFGFAPLYNSYQDLWIAVQRFKDILENKHWDSVKFKMRNAVT